MNPAALKAALSGDIKNALIASTPGGIEAQEAAGQKSFVASESIPKQINGATREQLEALGFKFGNDIDELFVQCQLPPGWTKKATEHSMHSDLIDDKGRIRAGIFYKAAFYDRRSDMYMKTRFRVEAWNDGSEKGKRIVEITDCDKQIKCFGEYDEGNWEDCKKLKDIAEAWLMDQYPDCKNPLAHW